MLSFCSVLPPRLVCLCLWYPRICNLLVLFLQIVHILNMTSAKIVSFLLHPEESLHSLQNRIEFETGISTGNQELLLETGICLDPRKPASQCVIDGVVRMILFVSFTFSETLKS